MWHKYQYAEIHFSNRIIKPILITPQYIKLGKNIQIRNNARIEGVSKYNNEQHFSPSIIIGSGVSIEQNFHLTCANLVSIGENTAIAANVTITDIHHPYEDINVPIERQDIRVKEVLIESNCKIYNNVVILPGVHIGKHVTIGANSVVNGDIPDFSVAVGTPARIIKRYNFETEQWQKTDKEGKFI